MRTKPALSQAISVPSSTQDSKGASRNTTGVFSPSRSQDSYIDGLSPDTSDAGEHSAEMEMEPREIDIHKGPANLGIKEGW